MQKTKQPKSEADELRTAGTVFWYLGCALTFSFINSVVQEQDYSSKLIGYAVAAVIVAGLQYGMTKAETALFDGTLPWPWQIDWREGGPVCILCIIAICALLMDVGLNIGGVWLFVSKIDRTGVTDVGFSIDHIGKVLITFIVSIVVALAPEAMKQFAKFKEQGSISQQRRTAHMQEPRIEERREQPEIKSRSGASEEEIELLKQRRAEMQRRDHERRAK